MKIRSSTTSFPEGKKALTGIEKEKLCELALGRAGKAFSQRILWERALERLLTTGLDFHRIERLLRNAPNGRFLSHLAELIAKSLAPKTAIDDLLEKVNGSPYSLADWLSALSVLLRHLEKEGRTTSLELALGYLHCCTLADASGSLPDLVSAMLEEYGFEG